MNTGLNDALRNESGCSAQAGDAAFFACAAEQITLVSACDATVDTNATFDACLDAPQIKVSDLKQSRRDMRIAWLAVKDAQQEADNIVGRADSEKLRNTLVRSQMLTGGLEASAAQALIVAANCCTVTASAEGPQETTNPSIIQSASLQAGLVLLQNAHDMRIEDINSEAAVRDIFLDQAHNQIDIDTAFQQYRTAEDNFAHLVDRLKADVFEAQRQRKYLVASPANDPAYRMVRDSKRLELATALESATRLGYLAARRAEYEYTARLSANNFRISDIYKARTANDVLKFLGDLGRNIGALPGSIRDAEIDDQDFTISVAQHVLGLTDSFLQGEGFSGPAIEVERVRRFQEWVGEHISHDTSGAEIVSFDFSTTSDTKGILSRIKQVGYDRYWLHKMGGIGQPLPGNTGTGINLVTNQSGLGRREARLVQAGQVELTSFAGCLFNYRLVPDAVMLGLDWPANQPTDTVSGIVQAGVNGVNGDPTRAFLGRPVAANWQVVIYTGPTPKLQVDQLNDIELKFSTTFATRESNQLPQPSACVRADF